MRSAERFLVVGGVVLALVVALGAHVPGRGVASAQLVGESAGKMATVDMFTVTEKLMKRPALESERQAVVDRWNGLMNDLQKEMISLQQELQILPPSDPKARTTMGMMQEKQQMYQNASQQGSTEIDQIGARHLTACFQEAKAAAYAVAEKGGYSHIMSTRSFDAKLEQTAVSAVLQEMLARPLIKGDPASDITTAVIAELKLE